MPISHHAHTALDHTLKIFDLDLFGLGLWRLKSLRLVGGWSYDYSIRLSPNFWTIQLKFLIWTYSDLALVTARTVSGVSSYLLPMASSQTTFYGSSMADLKVYGGWVGGPMIIASA